MFLVLERERLNDLPELGRNRMGNRRVSRPSTRRVLGDLTRPRFRRGVSPSEKR